MPARRALFATTISRTLEAFLLPHARHLQQSGWEVHALARDASTSAEVAETFDKVHEASWSRSLRDVRRNAASVIEVHRLLAKTQFDLVHVHTPIAAAVVRVVGGRRGTRIAYTAHGFHFVDPLRSVSEMAFLCWEVLAAARTDALITINELDAQRARRFPTISASHVHHIPGIGIDSGAVRRAASGPVELPDSVDCMARHPHVIVVAEMTRGKRHADIIQAVRLLRNSSVHFLFAGDGPLRDELQVDAHRRGLGDRVTFLGHHRNVLPLVRASEALLLASEREGMPFNVLEAMSVGTPVIGSDSRGTEELLRGGCGEIFRVGDVEGMAQAIDRVLADPEHARRITAAATAALDRYQLDRVLRRLDDVYASLFPGE